MTSEVIVKSKKLQKEADNILREYRFLEILENFGKVKVIGAYKYGVMTKPDIDIHIINKNADRGMALELIQELMSKEIFATLKFSDFTNYNKELANDLKRLPPLSYFMGFRGWFNGEFWRLDISFLKDVQEETNEYERYFNNIDEETRNKIIEYKVKVKENKNIECFSKDIYRAFMEGKADNYNDLLCYLKNNNF